MTRSFLVLLAAFLFLVPAAEARTGKVYQLQTEGPDAKRSTVFIDQSGERTLLPPSNVPSGSRVRLQGRSLDILQKAPRYSVGGQKGALIVSIGWPGSEASDISEEDYSQLTGWSESASDGRFRWSPVTSLELQLPQQPSCNEDAWTRATIQKLRGMGYAVYQNYGALAIMVPAGAPSKCVGTAYSYVGCFLEKQDTACGMSFYSSMYTAYETVVHELGHTVGLEHASTVPCLENGSPVALSYSGQCKIIEYGDRFDPMGASWRGNLFHPLFAEQIGWMNDAVQIPLDGQTHSLELSPYGELGASRAAFVPLPPAWSENSPGMLGIEYRADAGLDGLLYSGRCSPSDGVLLRMRGGAIENVNSYPVTLGGNSVLLDMHPDTEDVCDAGLQPGESWQDPTGGLRIRFLSRAAGASVQIETPQLLPSTVSLRGPRKRVTRSKGFPMSVRASRQVSGISKSDFLFRGSSKGCRVRTWSSEDWAFQNESVNVWGCTPGVVRVGVRAGSLIDEYGFLAPREDIWLSSIRILPRKRR